MAEKGVVKAWVQRDALSNPIGWPHFYTSIHAYVVRVNKEDIPVLIAPADRFVCIEKPYLCPGEKDNQDSFTDEQFATVDPCGDCKARLACPHENPTEEKR